MTVFWRHAARTLLLHFSINNPTHARMSVSNPLGLIAVRFGLRNVRTTDDALPRSRGCGDAADGFGNGQSVAVALPWVELSGVANVDAQLLLRVQPRVVC